MKTIGQSHTHTQTDAEKKIRYSMTSLEWLRYWNGLRRVVAVLQCRCVAIWKIILSHISKEDVIIWK